MAVVPTGSEVCVRLREIQAVKGVAAGRRGRGVHKSGSEMQEK